MRTRLFERGGYRVAAWGLRPTPGWSAHDLQHCGIGDCVESSWLEFRKAQILPLRGANSLLLVLLEMSVHVLSGRFGRRFSLLLDVPRPPRARSPDPGWQLLACSKAATTLS